MGNAPTDPMTDRRTALKTIAGLSAARLAQGAQQPTAASDRTYWTGLLARLAEPVLENLARGTLKRNMPVESASENQSARRKYSHLEAIARLLTGSGSADLGIERFGIRVSHNREAKHRCYRECNR